MKDRPEVSERHVKREGDIMTVRPSFLWSSVPCESAPWPPTARIASRLGASFVP